MCSVRRRLAEECSLHLAFRWYLGYDLDEATPNHSVLSKARSRYGREVFEKFFEHVLLGVTSRNGKNRTLGVIERR